MSLTVSHEYLRLYHGSNESDTNPGNISLTPTCHFVDGSVTISNVTLFYVICIEHGYARDIYRPTESQTLETISNIWMPMVVPRMAVCVWCMILIM
jgi:hypothetical protein